MKRYIILLTTLLATLGAVSQNANDTINRMVLVESTYNPIIAGAVKRNFIPEEIEPSMKKETIVYADESVPVQYFERMPRMVQSASMPRQTQWPGYVHLGLGNKLNFDGLAAYGLHFKERHHLTFGAHADGWQGKFKTDGEERWHSSLYDLGLDVDYKLLLGNATLTAGIEGSHYRYNYLLQPALYSGATDIQQGTRLGGQFRLEGNAHEHYRYHVAAQYTRLGRSAYFTNEQRHSEQHFHAELSFGVDFYEYGLASLLVRSDLLMYQGLDNYRTYSSFGFTPRWDYSYGDLDLTAGVNLDIQNLYGPAIQVSPACEVRYTPSKLFAANLTIDGGRQLHSFGALYALSPYWASQSQLANSYTFMNARLTGNLRIIEGLHFQVGGGYRIMGNALFENALDTLGTIYAGFSTHKAQVAYAHAQASYTYKDLYTIAAEGNYNHWMVGDNRGILTRAPQLDTRVNARVRIIPGLYAHTDCRFILFTAIEGQRERAIIDWSLGAHYALNERLSFFLDGHNLLNRHYHRYAGYPSQGINVMAGAAFKF